jgi:polysaccharide export outer membrane protein
VRLQRALPALSPPRPFALQDTPQAQKPAPKDTAATPDQAQQDGVAVPADYRIGPGDVLAIRFWRRDEVSADVVVRPDGKISLLLLDDVAAQGLTPEQLRDRIVEKAGTYFEEPRVTVVVKEVNSRTVYITGLVAKPGPYPLRTRMTVMQLIALAGGLLDWADAGRIAVVRTENGRETGFRVNYNDLKNLQRLEQNIVLRPGDTVIVP